MPGNRSIRLEVRVWYDERSRHIKIAGKGLTASTVSNDPASRRFHPNLFGKLAEALRRAGAPAPENKGDRSMDDDAREPSAR